MAQPQRVVNPSASPANQALKGLGELIWICLLAGCHAAPHFLDSVCHPKVAGGPGKSRGRLQQIALLSPAYGILGGGAMQLSQMWREHLQAGYPAEMRSLNIAGTAARELDAEITACVSACVTHSLKMDPRIERRLHDIAHALEHLESESPEVAAYCLRLNKLVSAVLVNANPAAVESEAEGASHDSGRVTVRPGVRRR
jgi:hypothetical protein